jgi:phage repressor protein C with HTH and peptisase S24 domain
MHFMDPERAKRLRTARKAAGYPDATAAARAFGWTIPTYLAHENGTRGFGIERGQRYASAFKVHASWLLTGEGSPGPTVKLRISGYVGVGGQVYLFADGSADSASTEEIELPAGMHDDYVAFKVRGDANYPVYRASEILLVRKDGIEPHAALNRDCVVRTVDGRTLLRTLSEGSAEKLFTLLCANAPPMADQAIEWAAPVEWTRRP